MSASHKTPEQLEQFGKAVNARLGDFFDGHVVVGITADTGQPVIIRDGRHIDDFKVLAVLNDLLRAAVLSPAIDT